MKITVALAATDKPELVVAFEKHFRCKFKKDQMGSSGPVSFIAILDKPTDHHLAVQLLEKISGYSKLLGFTKSLPPTDGDLMFLLRDKTGNLFSFGLAKGRGRSRMYGSKKRAVYLKYVPKEQKP